MKSFRISFVLIVAMLTLFLGTAQESTLNDDELLFLTTPASTVGASYGLNGINLQNGFGSGIFNTGLLQVGDDLLFSQLNGSKLKITEAAVLPFRTTELDKEFLTFFTMGTGQSLERWKFGRSSGGGSPPISSLVISRESIGINGGATLANAMVITSNLNVAIGSITPTEKLDVDGNARFRSVGALASTNDLRLTSTGVLTTSVSDARLKHEISDIKSSLSKVRGLRGVSFLWNEDPNAGPQLGLIAQEVKRVVPEVVNSNGEYLGVDYSEIIPLLIEAIKEQQDIIDTQQEEINELKKLEERVLQLEKDSN